MVLIIIDAASSFIHAYPQKTVQPEETTENITDFMDTFQVSLKSICGDMAFAGDKFQQLFKENGIKPIPTGPATPWPNRAEAAVRLFKKALQF